jgi:hypothetical protein
MHRPSPYSAASLFFKPIASSAARNARDRELGRSNGVLGDRQRSMAKSRADADRDDRQGSASAKKSPAIAGRASHYLRGFADEKHQHLKSNWRCNARIQAPRKTSGAAMCR